MRPFHTIRRYLVLSWMLVLPLLYWNCSGQMGSPANSNVDSLANVMPSDGNGNFFGVASSSGVVIARQDRNFTFTPSGGSGPFTVSGLPSWATFDSSLGRVSGSAHKMSDSGAFVITSAHGTYGPYGVQVSGNPLKEYQWHLNNTGQSAFAASGGVAGQDIHMTNSVFNGFTGAGVRVAVSDTGVMLSHEALAANVLPGESRNYLNNFTTTGSWLGDPTPDLSSGGDAHGTAVSSLALEKGWTGVGGRGVAPDAKFAGFLFIQAQTKLSQAGLLSAAINDQFTGNFDVFNYSWTDPQCSLIEYSSTLNDRLAASTASQRQGKGSVFLMAAGNTYVDDINNCYPSMNSADVFDNVNFSEMNTNFYVLNISAVNANGVSSSYSTPGSNLWVSSPGGEYGWDQVQAGSPQASMPAIIAADYPGCSSGIKLEDKNNSAFDRGGAPNSACNYVSTMNGTSAATPITTGAVALMLQVNPNLTWRDIKYILAKTADQVDPGSVPLHHPHTTTDSTNLDLAGYAYDQGWVTNTAGFHFHDYYGFGRINVDSAVAMARGFVSPLGTFTETNWAHDSGNISVAIPDASATGVSRTMSVAQNLTIEAVQLRVSTDGCAGDLGLELTAPSGHKSYLMNINSRIQDGAIQNHIFLTNLFYGELTGGNWTLKVVDGHVGCTAHLTNWKLNFAGH